MTKPVNIFEAKVNQDLNLYLRQIKALTRDRKEVINIQGAVFSGGRNTARHLNHLLGISEDEFKKVMKNERT